jgi:hypothetical protein
MTPCYIRDGDIATTTATIGWGGERRICVGCEVATGLLREEREAAAMTTRYEDATESERSVMLNDMASVLDHYFNGGRKGEDRLTGFCLMVWPFGNGPVGCAFVSNCEPVSLAKLVRELSDKMDREQ